MTAPPPGFLARPFAHRGLHDAARGRIENSRAAVLAAVARGFAVEIDVQLSADGEAMVFHDVALDRLTGESGPVAARDAAALGRIELTGGGETIPTLSEILSAVACRVPLLVEIKDQGGALDATGVGPLERRVVEALRGYAGPVAAMSFNPVSVAEIGRLTPGLPRGLTACAAEDYPNEIPPPRRRALAEMKGFDAGFVSYDARRLPTPRTRALRAAGVPVICWTIRDKLAARAALTHCDQVTFEGFDPEAG